ncbi:hypothetical protein HAPS_0337 [Glaesserella parasuis SH0165]|uniref:Uncharacterized protein n=1 Tax=Glaesserella parasuis serovar 5 (strain SH0165) TaxID=557723 RepID=B8F3W9_GLAP5|nr:hypothetical protein HAPS_0337 [Glaesserella parasuis SH0165]
MLNLLVFMVLRFNALDLLGFLSIEKKDYLFYELIGKSH